MMEYIVFVKKKDGSTKYNAIKVQAKLVLFDIGLVCRYDLRDSQRSYYNNRPTLQVVQGESPGHHFHTWSKFFGLH